VAKRTKKRIGQVIKTARVKLNLKAEDIAKACNVSRSVVYKWEAEDYVLPKNLPALASALQLSRARLEAINEQGE
jgi:DNA-binding transcriptional regulator YiaG